MYIYRDIISLPLKSLDLAHLCGISESLIFGELIFRARVRLVRSFTGVKARTSLTVVILFQNYFLSVFSSKSQITDIYGKDFKGFLVDENEME